MFSLNLKENTVSIVTKCSLKVTFPRPKTLSNISAKFEFEEHWLRKLKYRHRDLELDSSVWDKMVDWLSSLEPCLEHGQKTGNSPGYSGLPTKLSTIFTETISETDRKLIVNEMKTAHCDIWGLSSIIVCLSRDVTVDSCECHFPSAAGTTNKVCIPPPPPLNWGEVFINKCSFPSFTIIQIPVSLSPSLSFPPQHPADIFSPSPVTAENKCGTTIKVKRYISCDFSLLCPS